jgi:serine/threonine-protein kinase RsbW
VNEPIRRTDALDVVEVRIPAKAEWVAVARLAVAAVASRLDFSVEDIEDLKLAVAEACTICIRRSLGGGQLEILCEAGSEQLRLVVTGRASNQRQLAIAHPDDKLAIVIVESLMDAVALRSDDGTSCVEMIKHVTTAR